MQHRACKESSKTNRRCQAETGENEQPTSKRSGDTLPLCEQFELMLRERIKFTLDLVRQFSIATRLDNIDRGITPALLC